MQALHQERDWLVAERTALINQLRAMLLERGIVLPQRRRALPLIFVGIDWASTEHQVCLIGADGPGQRAFAHDADGIGTMVDWLSAQAERPEQVAVAIETPHGPIVEALMDRGIAVFAINPKQLVEWPAPLWGDPR